MLRYFSTQFSNGIIIINLLGIMFRSCKANVFSTFDNENDANNVLLLMSTLQYAKEMPHQT